MESTSKFVNGVISDNDDISSILLSLIITMSLKSGHNIIKYLLH